MAYRATQYRELVAPAQVDTRPLPDSGAAGADAAVAELSKSFTDFFSTVGGDILNKHERVKGAAAGLQAALTANKALTPGQSARAAVAAGAATAGGNDPTTVTP